MKSKSTLLIGLLSLALIMPVVSKAGCGSCGGGSGHKHEGSGHKHEGSMSKETKKAGKCHKKGPAMVKGAKVEVKNIKKGVVLTITADDKEAIKEIQERAKNCPHCHAKKDCPDCKDGKKCEKCKAKADKKKM